ncbi:cyclase family protein [Desulfitobacterium chlororespirans]|uniref:Kynurenine formamidase n=1 Tax=Desulfitobacterium chlororespirans DSM 11544 TaxID=1121395 RepID=A0A1M7SXM6_9FIRM|nr:cyclase family protein [Desulfitobacterium chlororespirans]SHN63273.1 Kynurenine formamidase [Desulfitobacterium chlororespirans DSM 11544]
MEFIDLSIAIEHQVPSDPPPIRQTIEYMDHTQGAKEMLAFFPSITEADLPDGLGWAVEDIKLCSHSGTHMDAPWHYYPTMNGGERSRTIDQMPLEWCFSDGIMLDFRDKPDGYLITVQDLEEAFAQIDYTLKHLDIVLIQTGAIQYWGQPQYLAKGCGLGREATLWLLERGVKVTGTDAWSWDRPLSVIGQEFAVTGNTKIIWEGHFAGREKEYYHMEKMNNLDKLPPKGFKVICFPIKIKDAGGGWVRPVALLP